MLLHLRLGLNLPLLVQPLHTLLKMPRARAAPRALDDGDGSAESADEALEVSCEAKAGEDGASCTSTAPSTPRGPAVLDEFTRTGLSWDLAPGLGTYAAM